MAGDCAHGGARQCRGHPPKGDRACAGTRQARQARGARQRLGAGRRRGSRALAARPERHAGRRDQRLCNTLGRHRLRAQADGPAGVARLTVARGPAAIALVTAREARAADADLPPLFAALTRAGAAVRVVEWDDASTQWSQFDLALLRSTWDYSMRLPEFLNWAEHTSASTHLLNPLPMVRWNTDKHYLGELMQADVRTVPTTFVEPGDSASQAVNEFLVQHASTDFVVKPAVSSGARDAQRYGRRELAAAVLHVKRLLDENRSVVLQPYLDRVDADGETALIYFGGM